MYVPRFLSRRQTAATLLCVAAAVPVWQSRKSAFCRSVADDDNDHSQRQKVEDQFVPKSKFVLQSPSGLFRVGRTAYCAVRVAVDYKVTFRSLDRIEKRLLDFQRQQESCSVADAASHANGFNAEDSFSRKSHSSDPLERESEMRQHNTEAHQLDELQAAYAQKLAALHGRNAERMMMLFKRNGGVYNKFGQFISTLNNVLPIEYTRTMAHLQDRAMPMPWTDVKAVVEQEFSKPIGDVFGDFEEEPIASASLAQVHLAIDKNGSRVAVKVQYRFGEERSGGDVMTLKWIAGWLGYFFPHFEYSWIFPEFEQNLRHELDFRQEAYNACRAKRLLADRRAVHIPAVDWDHTTRRVLTMEFIEGVKVNNLSEIKSMGLDPLEVGGLVLELFGDMLFRHGFVHCDPHPGNLLVRRNPGVASDNGPRPQLVLLDHGMYRRLAPEFRKAYCALWKALLFGDSKLGAEACKGLGMEGPIFETWQRLMPTATPHSASSRGAARPDGHWRRAHRSPPTGATPIEADSQTPHNNHLSAAKAQNLNDFLFGLSRDILWALRAQNIVRSLHQDLGGTSLQRAGITTPINNVIVINVIIVVEAHIIMFIKFETLLRDSLNRV
eukprot:Selendium_serpulae@DN5954_c2_g1_i4.p1